MPRTSSRSTRSDLALLSVPGLTARALDLAPGHGGLVGAVYGRPGGHELRAAPARIAAEITVAPPDARTRRDARRNAFVLAANLAPGDSGAPLVTRGGAVVGVAYGVDASREGVAFALDADEFARVLTSISDTPVPTGACLER